MNKKSVPVQKREVRATRTRTKKQRSLPKITIARAAVGFSVLILAALTIAMPLRNYFQQRAEVAQIEASIIAKQQEKENLLAEIERYNNPAYLDEITRNRLGVISPGQTAYRLMDPGIIAQDSTGSERVEYHPIIPWYTTLWNSISREYVEENDDINDIINNTTENNTTETDSPAQ